MRCGSKDEDGFNFFLNVLLSYELYYGMSECSSYYSY